LTHGTDDKFLDKIAESDNIEGEDSDANDTLTKRLFAKNPTED